MAANSFGNIFRITTAGESHGKGNIVIIDGVPSGLALSETDLQPDLDRRKPGQSKITTQRQEDDKAEILSGVFEGKTTGTSIAILIPNQDQRSKDYSNIKDLYRPGHADYTYDQKYGFRDYRGGGRSSARETAVRVAAGAIAKKILKSMDIEVFSYTKQIADIIFENNNEEIISLKNIESNVVRCPDAKIAEKMIEKIDSVRKDQDSIGGIAEVYVKNMPAGIGEPIFDRLKAELSKAMFSIPAVTGVEFGAGFSVANKRGSENNDIFHSLDGEIKTKTNNHGGILGGISTGMPIVFRCAIKPTSSISKEQKTVDRNGNEQTIHVKGRHDPCLVPRFIPIAEAMTAIVLLDQIMIHKAKQFKFV
jgi:chorismate synthase